MKNNDDERKTFLSKAEALISRSLYQSALNLAEERLSRFHGDVDARLVISRVMIQTGNYDKAREMMEESEDIIFWASRIYVCMGDLCQKKGLTEDAITFYRKFIYLNPKSPLTQGVSEKLDELLQTT